MNTLFRRCVLLAVWCSLGLVTAEEPDVIETPTAEEEKENPVVIINTSKGAITVELFEEKAPVTVQNFLRYMEEDYYAGTIFHRVIPGFMIQGGGFDADMNQKDTHSPIKNEADNGLKNERGTLAMARTPAVDSATSQFFINLADNAFLDHTSPDPRGYGYCVFGRVIDGMDVVDKIAQVRTGRHGPHENVPTKPVKIKGTEQR